MNRTYTMTAEQDYGGKVPPIPDEWEEYEFRMVGPGKDIFLSSDGLAIQTLRVEAGLFTPNSPRIILRLKQPQLPGGWRIDSTYIEPNDAVRVVGPWSRWFWCPLGIAQRICDTMNRASTPVTDDELGAAMRIYEVVAAGWPLNTVGLRAVINADRSAYDSQR